MWPDDEFKPAIESLPMQTALGLFLPRRAEGEEDGKDDPVPGMPAADHAGGSGLSEEPRVRVMTLAGKYRMEKRRGGRGGGRS